VSRLAVKLVEKCGLCKLSRAKAGKVFLTRQNMVELNYRMYGFPFYNNCLSASVENMFAFKLRISPTKY